VQGGYTLMVLSMLKEEFSRRRGDALELQG
jgi:hypothetical protein